MLAIVDDQWDEPTWRAGCSAAGCRDEVADIMARNDGRYNWYTNTYWIGRDRVLGARGCSDIRVKVTPVRDGEEVGGVYSLEEDSGRKTSWIGKINPNS
jgi:hypothetical protein